MKTQFRPECSLRLAKYRRRNAPACIRKPKMPQKIFGSRAKNPRVAVRCERLKGRSMMGFPFPVCVSGHHVLPGIVPSSESRLQMACVRMSACRQLLTNACADTSSTFPRAPPVWRCNASASIVGDPCALFRPLKYLPLLALWSWFQSCFCSRLLFLPFRCQTWAAFRVDLLRLA